MATYVLKDSYTPSVENSNAFNNILTKHFQSFTAEENYTAVRIGLKAGWSFPGAGYSLPGGIYTVSGGLPDVELSSFGVGPFGHASNPTIERGLLDSPVEITAGTQYMIFLGPNTNKDFSIFGRRGFGNNYYPGGLWKIYDSRIPGWIEPTGGDWDMYFEIYSEFSLTPTPSDAATGIVLSPTLSWEVD